MNDQERLLLQASEDELETKASDSSSEAGYTIIPDTVYILKKIRGHTIETQDLAATIRFINGYIERLEKL